MVFNEIPRFLISLKGLNPHDNGFRRGDRNVRQKYLNFLLIWKNK